MKIRFASYLNYAQSEWDKKHPDVLTVPMGVEEFLQIIANAELVLTDSFHAAAFSSILNTPFYALPRFKAQDKNSMNSRLLNLVQELGIPERYVDELDVEYKWGERELLNISNNLQRLQADGLDYLQKVL